MLSNCFCVFLLIFGVQCIKYEGERCVSKVDGFNGTCTRLRYCMFAARDIKMRKDPPPQLCSYNDTEPIVCCTDCHNYDVVTKVFISDIGEFFFKSGSKAKDKCREYLTVWQYSDCLLKDYGWLNNEVIDNKRQCYRPSPYSAGGGGTPAYRGQYPHMALLGYGDDVDSAAWLCGGSVISHRFILTAAHCAVADKIGPVKFVALGILKRTDPPKYWNIYNVKRIIPHPKYKRPIKYHDIALLEVSRRIEFGGDVHVLPACLKDNKREVEYVVNATATGWGALGPHEQLADNLQAMKLNKFSSEECSAAYPPFRKLENGIDHESQLCFGHKEKFVDTCQGDSGGPLHVPSQHSECAVEIIGITSFGSPCGTVGNPGVYTLVPHYISWIEDIVWP